MVRSVDLRGADLFMPVLAERGFLIARGPIILLAADLVRGVDLRVILLAADLVRSIDLRGADLFMPVLAERGSIIASGSYVLDLLRVGCK